MRNSFGQVRRFSHLFLQRIGALENSYLGRGRPLGEARVLFEVSPHGAGVRAVRSRLGLDSGYLSRLLRLLERQGLILVHKSEDDRRLRHVSLTTKGRAEHATYDALSDELALSILTPLDAPRRERLVSAMAEIEQLIGASTLDLQVEEPDSAAARWCLGQYFTELEARFETGFDPGKSNPANDEELTPPAGWLIVARLNGSPVGCGALKRKDETTGEIKRMWTAPAARGLGVARRILHTLEAIAIESGLEVLHLETNRALKEAQALYRKEGFEEIAPFNAEPYAHHWFAKRLRNAVSGP